MVLTCAHFSSVLYCCIVHIWGVRKIEMRIEGIAYRKARGMVDSSCYCSGKFSERHRRLNRGGACFHMRYELTEHSPSSRHGGDFESLLV